MAGKDVKMAKDCIGDDVSKLVDSLKDGEVDSLPSPARFPYSVPPPFSPSPCIATYRSLPLPSSPLASCLGFRFV
eukprot:760025-Hanusia_phi.AAC.2